MCQIFWMSHLTSIKAIVILGRLFVNSESLSRIKDQKVKIRHFLRTWPHMVWGMFSQLELYRRRSLQTEAHHTAPHTKALKRSEYRNR
jgi:hypothetical protein